MKTLPGKFLFIVLLGLSVLYFSNMMRSNDISVLHAADSPLELLSSQEQIDLLDRRIAELEVSLGEIMIKKGMLSPVPDLDEIYVGLNLLRAQRAELTLNALKDSSPSTALKNH